MAIVYVNGRLVQDQTAEQALRAAELRKQAKAEADARLAGLKQAQKTQASALKRIEAGKSPSKVDPTTGQIVTPAGSVVPPKGSGGAAGGGAGGGAAVKADTSAADKAFADAQERRRRYFAGLDAATALETQSKSAAQQALDALAGIYDPQQADVETQRVKQLQLLADAISGGQGEISKAEADFLRDIVAPTAYQNIPFVGLSQEQNPLLAALQAQGAGTAEVQSQRELDAQLANALKGLSERAATQTQRADEAYFEALKNAGRGASLAGRTYLSQRQPEISAGIESQFADLASKLRAERAGKEADIQKQLQDALTEAIKTRAETTANYGPLNVPITGGTETGNTEGGTGPTPPPFGREEISPFMPPSKKKINALRAIAGLAEAARAEGR